MKKIFMVSLVLLSATIVSAQTKVKTESSKAMTTPVNTEKEETEDGKTKTKPMTTPGDKMHNALHRRHKRSHGVKSKAKTDK